MKKLLLILNCCCFAFLNADPKVEELQNRVVTILPSLEGWCTKEKALALVDLVLEVKPKVCVDIGVFGGGSLFPIASALKVLGKGIVIGIDPWDKVECLKYLDPIADIAHLSWWGNLDMNYVYLSYLSMLKRFGLENYCLTMKTTSEKAITSIETIDILHIDGNHSESGFALDVFLYLPKVRSGGYILLNDSLWQQAQQAVDLLLEACDVVKLIDNGNCIIFQKR